MVPLTVKSPGNAKSVTVMLPISIFVKCAFSAQTLFHVWPEAPKLYVAPVVGRILELTSPLKLMVSPVKLSPILILPDNTTSPVK